MDLILTLDYELFGDGSGDIFTDLVEPTKKLLTICQTYNIKLTIFFEVVEYWKIKEEWDKGNKMGYKNNPISAIEEQIIEAFQQGHDIQLHIHPQWLNATFKSGQWIVGNHWSMADIPLIKNNQFNITLDEVFQKGIQILENMLKPIDNNYKCNIFRAGGFNILPSENIIKVLKKYHFIVDTSVFSGGYEHSIKSNYDYRKIHNKITYWPIKENNVLIQNTETISKNDIIEISIFSLPIYRIFKYDFTRIKAIFKNKHSAMQTIKGRTAKKSFLQKILFYFEKESLTWDFCLFNRKKMNYFYNKIQERKTTIYSPIVLIGHSKGFHSEDGLIFLTNKRNINFQTMTEAYQKIKGQKNV